MQIELRTLYVLCPALADSSVVAAVPDGWSPISVEIVELPTGERGKHALRYAIHLIKLSD